jgi:2-methylisocitrate lyase-like PEP mutase family enzyme
MPTSRAHVDLLRSLHAGADLLLLPNCWDAATARAVVDAGFPVVATSSAAVAESLGWGDHEQAPADEMLAAAARVARAVDVPVTADVEGGYGLPADDLAARLVASGVAGFNLEDTDHTTHAVTDVGAHVARLRAIRAALDATDTPLVVNARVDAFLHTRDHAAALDDAVARARAYVDAGADCVYPIVLADAALIEAFVRAVDPAPVNVLLTRAAPPLATLRDLGVRRVSLGGGLYRRSTGFLAEVLDGLRVGDTTALFG